MLNRIVYNLVGIALLATDAAGCLPNEDRAVAEPAEPDLQAPKEDIVVAGASLSPACPRRSKQRAQAATCWSSI